VQIFARNHDDSVLPASCAAAGVDYKCLECGQIVRVRAGGQRIRHFYHRRRTRRCRQSGKSLTHLRIQERLHELIPDSQLEHPFPTISRIADLYWPAEKIIFEVQCSPIAAEEVAARNADYNRLGLTVVWILHDRRFNRRHLTAAEHFLHDKPHYFTNIDKSGAGTFYDQKKIARQGLVLRRTRRFPVQLNHPLANGRFAGDADPLPQPKEPRARRTFRPYQILFRLILEKIC